MDSNLILFEWLLSYYCEKELLHLKAILAIVNVFDGDVINDFEEREDGFF